MAAFSGRKQLLAQIETYLAKTGISATRFGYMSTGDPCVVAKLRKGADIKMSTGEKIALFMATKKGASK